jgi:hypothetical protein
MLDKVYEGVEYCEIALLQTSLLQVIADLDHLEYSKAAQRLVVWINRDGFLTADEETRLAETINAHITAQSEIAEARRALIDEMDNDADNRWLNSPFRGKSPAQIRDYIAARAAAWGNLAQAKPDIVQWFTDLASLVAIQQKRDDKD